MGCDLTPIDPDQPPKEDVDIVIKLNNEGGTVKAIAIVIPCVLAVCLVVLIYTVFQFKRKGTPRHILYCKRSMQEWVWVTPPSILHYSHKTQWCWHPYLADFGSSPASRLRRTERALALIPPSGDDGRTSPKLPTLLPLAGAPAVGLERPAESASQAVHRHVQCHFRCLTWKRLLYLLGFTTARLKQDRKKVLRCCRSPVFYLFRFQSVIYFQNRVPLKHSQTK